MPAGDPAGYLPAVKRARQRKGKLQKGGGDKIGTIVKGIEGLGSNRPGFTVAKPQPRKVGPAMPPGGPRRGTKQGYKPKRSA